MIALAQPGPPSLQERDAPAGDVMHGRDDPEVTPSTSIAKNLALLLKTLGCQSGVRGRNLLHEIPFFEVCSPEAFRLASITGLIHWSRWVSFPSSAPSMAPLTAHLAELAPPPKRNAAALLNVCTESERDVGRAS